MKDEIEIIISFYSLHELFLLAFKYLNKEQSKIADERVFISSTDGKIYCFGIDPETYFDKAEKYEEQGKTDRTKEFYTRAREYYQSQGNPDMVKKCDARLQEGSYSGIVVLVGCLILGVLIYVKTKV